MRDWDLLSIIHGKLLGCSNDAVATFWRAVTWARGPGAHARPGFLNRAQLRAWSGGVSAKRFEAVVVELQDAGKPQHEHGLIDPAEGGWWIHDFEHYGRAVDIVASVAPEPVPIAPESARARAISSARAEAGRAGGHAKAVKQRAVADLANPALPTKQPGFASLANADLSFQVGSDLDLENREIPKENPRPKDLSGSARGEVCQEDEDFFSKLPIGERAQLVNTDPALARVAKPHLWSEVIGLSKLFAATTGQDRNVTAYERDGGVRALVTLLAAFEHDRLIAILPRAVSTPWWREKPLRPLSHLSVAVVEDALGRDAEAAQAETERRKRLTPSLVPRKVQAPTAPTGAPVSAAEALQLAMAGMKASGG